MSRRTLTPEEREELQKHLVKSYVRTKEWLEKNHPVLKRKIDNFNHRLFHFMKDHHINLMFMRDTKFTDWRAQSAQLFVPCVSFTFFNIVILAVTRGYIVLGNLLFSALAFLFYMAAVQIIETSRYSHEGEIAPSDVVSKTPTVKMSNDMTNSALVRPALNNPPTIQQKPKSSLPSRLFGYVELALFGYIAYLYFTEPEALKSLCLSDYTSSFLTPDAVQTIKAFFSLDQATGFIVLLFTWILASFVIRIPFRILAWLASKMAPDKHTRDI